MRKKSKRDKEEEKLQDVYVVNKKYEGHTKKIVTHTHTQIKTQQKQNN